MRGIAQSRLNKFGTSQERFFQVGAPVTVSQWAHCVKRMKGGSLRITGKKKLPYQVIGHSQFTSVLIFSVVTTLSNILARPVSPTTILSIGVKKKASPYLCSVGFLSRTAFLLGYHGRCLKAGYDYCTRDEENTVTFRQAFRSAKQLSNKGGH